MTFISCAQRQGTLKLLQNFVKEFKMKRCLISKIRSDYDGELENLCEENDFKHEFSTSKTPEQNIVGERKNSVLQEMGRTMLNDIVCLIFEVELIYLLLCFKPSFS
jgi:hypothetical protein